LRRYVRMDQGSFFSLGKQFLVKYLKSLLNKDCEDDGSKGASLKLLFVLLCSLSMMVLLPQKTKKFCQNICILTLKPNLAIKFKSLNVCASQIFEKYNFVKRKWRSSTAVKRYKIRRYSEVSYKASAELSFGINAKPPNSLKSPTVMI